MLFFMAAAKVPSVCVNYDDFVLWLKLWGIVPLCVGLALNAVVVCLAVSKSGQLFKLGLRLQALSQLIGAAFVIWGWVVYSKTNGTCESKDTPDPKLLAFVFLIMNSISLPCLVCISIKKGLSDVHAPQQA